ncbi:ABC transporter ATP-binding protein [Microlunatus ginsengisoli]|uniref:ABC transporter ATP-binding protein n=1 Tax=Microlunatus ginsengisoli TaxID=363863 RepID=A0ABP6ZY92_9ACTN
MSLHDAHSFRAGVGDDVRVGDGESAAEMAVIAGATRTVGAVSSEGAGEPEALIRTRRLTKRFRHATVVDGIDLTVPAGAIYGFLGPNGSGKTTTIRMLLGLIRPVAGEVEVLGLPIPARSAEALPRVGSLVEGPAFHPYLSGWANLARIDAADPAADPRTARTRIDAALDRVGLLAAATKRYRAYSLGMRQRLAIASALLMPRELLVLDEPTNGLDPQGTREVRHLIGQLAQEGVTVLVSSHLLSEVEQMCSHIGVMYEAKLVWQGRIDDLRAGAVQTVRVETEQPAEAARVLTDLGLADVAQDPDGRVVTGLPGEVEIASIVPRLVREHVSVLGFTVSAPSLEDLFVQLTGEGFDVSG